MGNCNANASISKSKSKPPSTKLSKAPLTFGRDPNLNIADYTMENSENTTKIKSDVNGQQFIVSSCRQCKVYLPSHIAALTVDECVNCVVVTGPIESSAFIRDCKDSVFVLASGQFRARSCSRCKFLIGVRSTA